MLLHRTHDHASGTTPAHGTTIPGVPIWSLTGGEVAITAGSDSLQARADTTNARTEPVPTQARGFIDTNVRIAKSEWWIGAIDTMSLTPAFTNLARPGLSWCWRFG